MHDPHPHRVVFLGTHGQHNIGDELLLETFLHQLGPEPHYAINTYDPESTRAQLEGRYNFDLIDTAGDRLTLLRHLWHADRVVFGGGSIIKELYATTGRNRYATLLMILAIVVFARIARQPVAMFNIGVGPIASPVGRRLARFILRRVELVTVRDPGSFELCRSLGLDVVPATDAVFSVGPDWLLGEPVPEPRSGGGALRIALNLNYHIENPDNWDHFLDRLAEALQRLGAEHRLEVHTLPMQSRFKENDDATILRSFARRLSGISFVHHEPTNHEEAARIIAQCDLVLSERLHAIVMASILGVPSFVLAYDVKVRQLAAMLGLEDYMVDINQPFTAEELEHPLRRLVEDLDGGRRLIAPRVEALHSLARESFASARQWQATSERTLTEDRDPADRECGLTTRRS